MMVLRDSWHVRSPGTFWHDVTYRWGVRGGVERPSRPEWGDCALRGTTTTNGGMAVRWRGAKIAVNTVVNVAGVGEGRGHIGLGAVGPMEDPLRAGRRHETAPNDSRPRHDQAEIHSRADVLSIRSADRRMDLQEVTSRTSSSRRLASYRLAPPPPPPPEKPLWRRFKDALRALTAWVFSNVGICVLVIGYLLLGAVMFMELEGPDGAVRSHVPDLRRETVGRLWDVTERYNTLHPDSWSKEVTMIIVDYQAAIIEAEEQGYDGNDIPTNLWTFSGAFLYSITVITTIGEEISYIKMILPCNLKLI